MELNNDETLTLDLNEYDIEIKDNKVYINRKIEEPLLAELSNLKSGEEFELGGNKFIVLQQYGDNSLLVSSEILNVFGFNPNLYEYLTIQILSPMIVLKGMNVESAEEISHTTGLPIDIAKQRFKRYQYLLTHNSFGMSKLEVHVLSQFQKWLHEKW